MSVGSTFAYEPTHSIATKGATRQSPAITRVGVTTGAALPAGVPVDADGSGMGVAPFPGGPR